MSQQSSNRSSMSGSQQQEREPLTVRFKDSGQLFGKKNNKNNNSNNRNNVDYDEEYDEDDFTDYGDEDNFDENSDRRFRPSINSGGDPTEELLLDTNRNQRGAMNRLNLNGSGTDPIDLNDPNIFDNIDEDGNLILNRPNSDHSIGTKSNDLEGRGNNEDGGKPPSSGRFDKLRSKRVMIIVIGFFVALMIATIAIVLRPGGPVNKKENDVDGDDLSVPISSKSPTPTTIIDLTPVTERPTIRQFGDDNPPIIDDNDEDDIPILSDFPTPSNVITLIPNNPTEGENNTGNNPRDTVRPTIRPTLTPTYDLWGAVESPTISPTIITQTPTMFPTSVITNAPSKMSSTAPSTTFMFETNKPTISPVITQIIITNPPTASKERAENIQSVLESLLEPYYDSISSDDDRDDGKSIQDLFNDPKAPQARALNWIIHIDPLNLNPASSSNSNDIEYVLLQRYVIVCLYYGFYGDLWSYGNEGWLSGKHECEWSGVICESFLVKALMLNNRNMSGEIPKDIAALQDLSILNLKRNKVGGTLPPVIGMMMKLEYIDLENNSFLRGRIPSELGLLKKLEELKLFDNSFSHTIPSELGKLRRLRDLGLGMNALEFEIPSELGYLASIENLELWSNRLTGTIPFSLSKLKHTLKNFYVDENYLSGTLPGFFGSFYKMEVFSVGDNSFEGVVPPSLFEALNIKSLWLNRNLFTGTLPYELYKLTQLKNLYMENNMFSGTISKDISRLENLVDLRLYSNKLSGCIPQSLFLLPSLSLIYLDNNGIECSLPSYIFSSLSITDLRLNNNKLYGSLPDVTTFAPLPLKVLMISGNALDGSIPNSMLRLLDLRSINLSDNFLTGSIPFLGELPFLEKLSLNDNSLSGAGLSNLLSRAPLTHIRLQNNKLREIIPERLKTLTGLRELTLEKNELAGSIPTVLCEYELDKLTSDCLSDKVSCQCCNKCF